MCLCFLRVYNYQNIVISQETTGGEDLECVCVCIVAIKRIFVTDWNHLAFFVFRFNGFPCFLFSFTFSSTPPPSFSPSMHLNCNFFAIIAPPPARPYPLPAIIIIPLLAIYSDGYDSCSEWCYPLPNNGFVPSTYLMHTICNPFIPLI